MRCIVINNCLVVVLLVPSPGGVVPLAEVTETVLEAGLFFLDFKSRILDFRF